MKLYLLDNNYAINKYNTRYNQFKIKHCTIQYNLIIIITTWNDIQSIKPLSRYCLNIYPISTGQQWHNRKWRTYRIFKRFSRVSSKCKM